MGKDAAQVRAEFRVRLGQLARELGRELYPEGLPEGVTFSELEDIAGALGDEVARQLIENQVRARAEGAEDEEKPALCPTCAGPLRSAHVQAREVTTTRGPVAWTETMRTCPRCRRAFSPSEPGVGAGRHGLQPAGAAEGGPRGGQGGVVSGRG